MYGGGDWMLMVGDSQDNIDIPGKKINGEVVRQRK